MALVRGEDISFIANFKIEEFDVDDIQNAVLSIANGGEVDHHGLDELIVDSDTNEIRYEIDQMASLALEPNSTIQFELNVLANDKRHCSLKLSASIEDTLYGSVLDGATIITEKNVLDYIISNTYPYIQKKATYTNSRVAQVNGGALAWLTPFYENFSFPNALAFTRGTGDPDLIGVNSIRMDLCTTVNFSFPHNFVEIYMPSFRGISPGTDSTLFSRMVNLKTFDMGYYVPESLERDYSLQNIILHGFVEPVDANVFQGTQYSKVDSYVYDPTTRDYAAPKGGYLYVPAELVTTFELSTWPDKANIIEIRPIEGSEYE